MSATQVKQVFAPADLAQALVRISHEIVEKSDNVTSIVLAGILTRGVYLAIRLATLIAEHQSVKVPVVKLDVRPFRDDVGRSSLTKDVLSTWDAGFSLDGKMVVLVDDVVNTGRTFRSAMDALLVGGRPESIHLAALIDRGHRELPIRISHVGKNYPTNRNDLIKVRLHETDGVEGVDLISSQ